LLHERLGFEVSVSPDATVGEGFRSRSTEMGDLQRKHPIIELIRNAMAKSGEKYGGGSSPLDHLLHPGREQALRRRLLFLSFLSRLGRS
jgi:hypothetical protein